MLIESLRNYSRENRNLAIGLAVLPLLLAAGFIAYSQSAPAAPDWPMADYIDEATGVKSVRRANELPPLKGDSGKLTVVRAIYLTASTPDKRFLAYLEKLSDEALTKSPAGRPSAPTIAASNTNRLVRKPEPGEPWLKADTAEAMKMLDKIFKPDPALPPLRLCPPSE